MLFAQLSLTVATLLCSLIAGFLFAFAVVVMPGLRNLPDREFIRAFQEIDGVIQRGQPLFGAVWLGSAVALGLSIALGLGQFDGADRLLLIAAGGVYFLGVQLPTFAVNVPLNNELQAFVVDESDEAGFRSTRERFEPRWNRWNTIRTGLAVLSAAALCVMASGL